MAESAPRLERHGPLAAIAIAGRYGALPPDGPGLRFAVRHPLSIVALIARKGKASQLAGAVRDSIGIDLPGAGLSSRNGAMTTSWAGPEQWLVIAEDAGDGALQSRLAAAAENIAAVIDQSHGRVAITLAGPRARAVLAKGTAVDLHASRFAVGQVALTQIAHVGVHLTATAPDAFELLVFRGFAESLFEFLAAMAAEYGYEVGPVTARP